MFNLYQFQKKQKQYEEIQQVQSEFLEKKKIQQNHNQEYTQNYKKRIENFMNKLQQKPILQQTYTSGHSFRDERPQLNIQKRTMQINGFNTERDRLKSQRQKNDVFIYEHTPVQRNIVRDRKRELELSTDFHFKDTDRINRLQNMINQEQFSILDQTVSKFGEQRKVQSSSKTVQQKQFFLNREQMVRLVQKNFLPELHNKTHFQAMTSLSLRIPHFTFKEAFAPNISEIQKDEQRKELDIIQMTSTKLLKENKVVKQKGPEVNRLFKKQGKLVSNPDQSISQIYNTLLNQC